MQFFPFSLLILIFNFPPEANHLQNDIDVCMIKTPGYVAVGSKRGGMSNLFKKKRKKIEVVEDSDSDVSVDLEELQQVRGYINRVYIVHFDFTLFSYK